MTDPTLPNPFTQQARDTAFWAVIPAGGAGTRLWPLSRAARPKFLLPLLGERSLLQQTVARLAPLTTPERTLVVCGEAHAAATSEQLPALASANIIVEPSPIGSGPAIALAAAIIAQRDPDAVMGSFAADHDITDLAAFATTLRAAIAAAATGYLVTIGLTPTRAETGYGYIERTSDKVAATPHGDAFRAARFVEKPDAEEAEAFLRSGRFLWNASMFVWQVSTFLAELARLEPEVLTGVTRIAQAWDTPHQEAVMAEVWPSLPSGTIDQAIMERAPRVAVVPANFGWSDVGDWHGLGELIEHDALGNSVRADLLQIETTNCVIWSESERMVALLGLDNIIVVDTPDALLIVDRSKAQEVRRVVERLRALRRTELS